MHITKAISSSEFANGLLDFKVLSSDPSGFSHYHLNLNGDDRLDKILKLLQADIKSNHWTVADNEGAICSRVVTLLHQDEFYGGYNKAVIKASEHKDLAALAELDRQIYSKTDLKLLKSGEAHCFGDSAAASFILHKAGIKNYLCVGNGWNSTDACHAFVQTETGNIIETTQPLCAYAKTLNHGLIANGQVAIVRFRDGQKLAEYGGGEFPDAPLSAFFKSTHKEIILASTIYSNTETAWHELLQQHPKLINERKNNHVSILNSHGLKLHDITDTPTPLLICNKPHTAHKRPFLT